MLSAYRIGNKVWLIGTKKVADPETPGGIPLGSPAFTPDEARQLAAQILEAADKPIHHGPFRVKQ